MSGDEPFPLPVDGTLDLHAFSPRDAGSLVEEYVNEAHARGLAEVRIVHGRGTGTTPARVSRTMSSDSMANLMNDRIPSTLCRAASLRIRF